VRLEKRPCSNDVKGSEGTRKVKKKKASNRGSDVSYQGLRSEPKKKGSGRGTIWGLNEDAKKKIGARVCKKTRGIASRHSVETGLWGPCTKPMAIKKKEEKRGSGKKNQGNTSKKKKKIKKITSSTPYKMRSVAEKGERIIRTAEEKKWSRPKVNITRKLKSNWEKNKIMRKLRKVDWVGTNGHSEKGKSILKQENRTARSKGKKRKPNNEKCHQ